MLRGPDHMAMRRTGAVICSLRTLARPSAMPFQPGPEPLAELLVRRLRARGHVDPKVLHRFDEEVSPLVDADRVGIPVAFGQPASAELPRDLTEDSGIRRP